MKKKKPIVLEELSPEELVKYEIAKELGLFDRVMTNGWGSLSAKETGRIGGILAKRRKKEQQEPEATRVTEYGSILGNRFTRQRGRLLFVL